MQEKTEVSGNWRSFEHLSGREVHDLLKLRQDIFVVEQECAYPDIDGLDLEAQHYFLTETVTDRLVGALRLFEAGGVGEAARIGRVVIDPNYRGHKLGYQLMRAGIERARGLRPRCQILVSAQAHLHDFYTDLGFVAASEIYLEDGIPHLDMCNSDRVTNS